MRGILVGLVSLIVLALPAGASAEGGCPNKAVREQQGYASRLADCRAYELVTPVEKGDGALPTLGHGGVGEFFTPTRPYGHSGYQASVDGDEWGFSVELPFPGAQAGNQDNYLAARGESGWSSQSITPPQAAADEIVRVPHVSAYSPDLSIAAFADGGAGFGGAEEEEVGQDSPSLVPGEPPHIKNLFLRDDAASTYQLMNLTPSGVTPAPAGFDGASADLSHILFASDAQLTPEAPEELARRANLFEWAAGAVTLVDQIPTPPATRCGGDAPACSPSLAGAALGGGEGASIPAGHMNAVSPDASKVYFKDAPSETLGSSMYARTTPRRLRSPLRRRPTARVLVGPIRWVPASPDTGWPARTVPRRSSRVVSSSQTIRPPTRPNLKKSAFCLVRPPGRAVTSTSTTLPPKR